MSKNITIDLIKSEWNKDFKIDEINLDKELANLPYKFTKYLNFYSDVGMIEKGFDIKLKKEIKKKWMYYSGKMDQKELKLHNLNPFNHKILKQDIEKFLNSDDEINRLSAIISSYKIMKKHLEEIMRILNNRGYHIKSMIDWRKFTNGSDF